MLPVPDHPAATGSRTQCRYHLTHAPMNNTLLDRCAKAYESAILSQYSHERAIAAVLDHVAAEIILLSQRNKAMTAFECARLLIDASKKTNVD